MGITYIENPGPLMAPNFLTARSPKGLRRLMLRNNVKHKGFVVYESIQFVASDNRWYAWYYVKPNKDQSIDEMVQEVDGNGDE